LGKFLIVIGLVIAAAGVLISLGVPLGRLPGDISYRRGNVSFHFPNRHVDRCEYHSHASFLLFPTVS